MNQLERITFEINILKEAVILVQEHITRPDIPPARGEYILRKYQTRIHHLSSSIVHQQQHQQLHQLETQRQQLMQAYQSQLTEIQQAIRDLKTTASYASPLETPQTNEPAPSAKRSRLRRLLN
jgi:dTDP-4-amino-4,6-dideoxygalactose transaminase